ncbi:MAG: hypothetical protein Q4B26_06620 [Eubacteriales bacterium]|nr:hypothetical protein [Eubacteriales bacterium]
MASQVPQKNDFDNAQCWDKYSNRIRWIIGVVSLVPIVLSILKIDNDVANKIIGFTLLTMAILNIYTKYRYAKLFRKAEFTRRNGFLDNAFGTKLADIESIGYYDTDDIELGYRKFLANLHENSFYSNKIGKEMYEKTEKLLIAGVIAFLTITIPNIFDMQVVVALVDLLIAAEIFEEYQNLKTFTEETEKVIDECKSIWESEKLNKKVSNKTIAAIMKAYSHYESTMAYASIILDSEIYNKLNAPLTAEWNEMKNRYNMKG